MIGIVIAGAVAVAVLRASLGAGPHSRVAVHPAPAAAPAAAAASQNRPVTDIADRPWHGAGDIGGIASENFGWIVTDSEFLVTHDAGSTWLSVARPTIGFEVSFTDASHGIAAFTDETRRSAAIATTTDGGKSWSRIASIDEPDGVWVGGLSLSEADHQWWLLITRQSSSAFNSGDVFTSGDDGRTWDRRSTAGPGGYIVALGRTSAVIAGGVGYGHLYVSSDDGRTWPETQLALPGTGASSPPEYDLFSPIQVPSGAVVPGVRHDRAFVVHVGADSSRVDVLTGSGQAPLPLDATRTIVEQDLYTGTTRRPMSGPVPVDAVALIGEHSAVGLLNAGPCRTKETCEPRYEIVQSRDLVTWSVVSQAELVTVPPPEGPTTTTTLRRTGPVQTLSTGTSDSRSWELNAVPTESGFCFAIGYGSPEPRSCVEIPVPEPPILAMVNRDPVLAVGIVRSDVHAVVLRFTSGKTQQVEVRPARPGFPKGGWYIAAIPEGEEIYEQDALAADGTRIRS